MALSTIISAFVLHLTLGRNDGRDDFNLFPSRKEKPPSPEARGISNSKPGDLYNDDSFWTGLGRKNHTPSVSPSQNGDEVEDDPPMDANIDIPTGGSTPLLSPNPFPQDPYSEYLALVLGIIPDVSPDHAMELIKSHHPPYKDQVVEAVVQVLLDDHSYPKVESDFASVDRPKPTGRNYGTLALVSCLLLMDPTRCASS